MQNTFKSVVNQLLHEKKYKWKREIAKAMGITPQRLSRYYNGSRALTLDAALEMFKKVGCDVKITIK